MSPHVRTRGRLAIAVVALVATAGCGGDTDEGASTTGPTSEPSTTASTTTGASTTTAAPASGDELCAAYLRFENAQDGAQRNTALGGMRSAAGGDPVITEALDVLDAGDQDPGTTMAAATALRRAVRAACDPAAVCDAWAAFENAQDGAQLNTALGDLRSALDDPGIAPAIDTLDAGDVDPADVVAASEQVSTYLDPLCGDDG